MGVTDIFYLSKADLSTMSSDSNLFVRDIMQVVAIYAKKYNSDQGKMGWLLKTIIFGLSDSLQTFTQKVATSTFQEVIQESNHYVCERREKLV